MKSFIKTLLSLAVIACFFACENEEPGPEPEPTSLKIGLILHTEFEGNANDISRGGFVGSVVGATVAEDRFGRSNGAYYFDGDDHINYGNVTELALGGGSTYTMAAWVKPEQLGKEGRSIIISKWNGGVLAGWYLGINENGTPISYRNVSPWAVSGNTSITWGEYVHVAATYDGKELSVYINGVKDGSLGFSTHPSDTKTDMVVGGIHSKNVLNPAFKGTIDEIRFYDRVLEQEELEWLADN